MREELELFAHNLRVYMEHYGYNQTTLGQAVGKALTTVADWTHGRKFPRIETLDKLCEVFHCKRSDLVEKYTTEETIHQADIENELVSYLNRLNPLGYQRVLQYVQDLSDKYFEDGDADA